jgi:hypothetical protein
LKDCVVPAAGWHCWLPPPLDLRKRSYEDLVEEFVDDIEMPRLVKNEGDDDSSCSHSDSDSSISNSSDDDSSATFSISSNWESEGDSEGDSEGLIEGLSE